MAEPSDATDRSLDRSEGTELEKKENDGDLLEQTLEKVVIGTVVSSKVVEEAKLEVTVSSAETNEQLEETDPKVKEESTVGSIMDHDSVHGNVRIAADEGEGTLLQDSLVDTGCKEQKSVSTEHYRTKDAELTDAAVRTRIHDDLQGYHEVPSLQVHSVETSQDPQGESNTESKANYDDDETGPQADINAKDPVLDDPCREEMNNYNVHMVDVGRDGGHEASVMQTTSAESNRNIQEEPVAFDDTVGQQTAHVSEDAESADAVVVVHFQVFGSESEAVDKPTLNLHTSQEASSASGFVLADEDLCGKADRVAKEPSPADPVVEIRLQEISEDAACNEFMMDGSQGRDGRDSIMSIMKENGVLDKVPVDDNLGHVDYGTVDLKFTDTVPEVVADTILEVEPHVTEREREDGCGFVVDDSHNRGEKASIPKAHTVVTSKSNEEGDGSFDSIHFGDVIGHGTDCVSEDAKLNDPAIRPLDKVRDVETHVDGDVVADTILEVEPHTKFVDHVPEVVADTILEVEPHMKFVDNVPEVVADTILEVEPHVTERESGGGFVVDDGHNRGEEASIPKSHTVVTSKSNEEGDDCFDSIHVGDVIGHETDCVSEDAKLNYPAIRPLDKVRDVETHVDGDVVADTILQVEPHMKFADTVPEVVADTILEVEPHVTERERESGCGFVVDDGHKRGEEASIPKSRIVVTSKSNEEGDGSFDSIHVGDVIGHETDCVAEDAKLNGPAIRPLDKVRDVETHVDGGLITNVDEVDDGGQCAFEVSSLQKISSVETSKYLQKDNELEPNHTDDDTAPRADVTTTDPVTADQEVDVQAQETDREMEVTNEGIMDVDKDDAHDASASQTCLMNAKRHIQGVGSVLGPDPFDGTIGHKAGCTTGLNQDELVVVQTPVTCEENKAGNGSMMNPHKDTSQPASVPQTTLVYTRRNILKQASRLDKVFSVGSLDDQSDHVAKARMKQTESNGGDGFTMEGGDNEDHEASILQASLTATNQNQNVQEVSTRVFDSAPLEVDRYKNVSDHVNPSMEVKPSIMCTETEVSVGPEINADQDRDREASSLKTPLVDANQYILREELEGPTAVHVAESYNRDANSLNIGTLSSNYPVTGMVLAQNVVDLVRQSADTHLFDENAVVQGEITRADANPIIELQSQGEQLVDQKPDGKQDGVGVVSCFVVEIQTVPPQRKEHDYLLHYPNPDSETRSVSSSVDGNLGENAHTLGSSLGNQIIVSDSEVVKNGSDSEVIKKGSDSEVIKKGISPSSACEKAEPSQELDGKHETQASINTENVLIGERDENTDAEQNLRVEEGELLQGTYKQVVHCSAMGISTSPMENKQHISYHLPSIDTTIFSVSDLVWGKVKSHPWWPGQIFDPSNASQLALKYQKKDSILVAYFGDKTFAWCDKSQLKPFFSYFSQMEKQCSSDIFVTAVNDIMLEISRRMELGMTCSCVPEETYADIKFQKVDNAGVQRGKVTPILDRTLGLNYLQPRELIVYIKKIAQFPNGGVDKLELVIAKSQLKAFYSSMGYPELPKFTVDRGLIEDVAKIPLSNNKGAGEDTAKRSAPAITDLSSGEGKLRSKYKSFKKREHVMEDNRKHKRMFDLIDKKRALHLEKGGRTKSDLEGSERLLSSPSGTKHTVLVSDSTGSERHKKETLDLFEDIEPISPSPVVTNSFKIGEFIRRAASQLTGAPPIVKCQQETFPVNSPQDDYSRGDVTDFDALPLAPEENKGTITSLPENSSPDEMLSQLCLATRDRMNGDSSVPTMIASSTSIRNSCTLEGNRDVEKRKRARLKKMISQSLFFELFSDISSSEEKTGEKLKRARPKRYSQVANVDTSSSEKQQRTEKCSFEDQHIEKRRRGRPKRAISQPITSDISSSEGKHVEKPKRGRRRKVTSYLASSDMSMPDHIKDSYWSESKHQKRSRKKFLSDDFNEKGESHMRIRRKRKSAGEVALSLPSGSVPENEHQLQPVTTSPNKKYASIAERPIISAKEKTAEEDTPTALILSFSSSDTLPSSSDLIRIFSHYGPLKEAETDVLRKTNRARVVFRRRADAESAFSSAGKYSIFGPGLLSYQLKYLPCSPKPARQIRQVQQGEASATKPHESNDSAPIVLPQDNLNPPIATSQENHDPTFLFTTNNHVTPVTTANDDTTPVSRPQDDSGSVSLPVKKHNVSMQGCNLDVSEAAEDATLVEADAKISPRSDYDATSITQPEEYHDETSNNTMQDKYDSTPITTSGDYHDAVPFTTCKAIKKQHSP